ncbi:hypothetical protein B0T12DRAFT_424761 [Alternaria alternata]|nr:hypothetical protein B0T12DRAFT_424761 [Alternaria alternata]
MWRHWTTNAMFKAVYRRPRTRIRQHGDRIAAPARCTHARIRRGLYASSCRHVCLTQCATEQNGASQLRTYLCAKARLDGTSSCLGLGRGSYTRQERVRCLQWRRW